MLYVKFEKEEEIIKPISECLPEEKEKNGIIEKD
jgi:hypothetical protein